MPGIASCVMDISRLWVFATALIALITSLMGCVVGCIIKARECRRLRLENDKLDLEIDILKVEVAKKGVQIAIPRGDELEAALRDRRVFCEFKRLGSVKDLTRASDPEDQPSEEDFVVARKLVLNALAKMAVVGVVMVCSLFAVVLWW